MNAINTHATPALHLVPISSQAPIIVSRETQLAALLPVFVGLVEAFRLLDAVTTARQRAFATMTNDEARPYEAVIADAEGHLLAIATSDSPQGLAAAIRAKLMPPSVGYGVAS